MMNRRTLWAPLVALLAPSLVHGQDAPVALRTSRILDGRGGIVTDAVIVVRDGRIAEVGPRAAAPSGAQTFDLRRVTVLPGLIDTHVHITNHFHPDGRAHSAESKDPPEEQILYGAENAYLNLMAGFTTVQSMGAPLDRPLRDAIARGVFPGARVLTSLRWIEEGTPDELRQKVREVAAEGADLIKLFASGSLRIGAPPTMTQEQLDAACDEARKLGLRTAVHAHGPESARRAAQAGCTVVEHGAFLDRATLEFLARRGTYFDPNIYLVSINYLENKAKFLGIGNYTEEGFRRTEESIPVKLNMFKEALAVPGLKIVFGTDAVAGAHGRQAIELIYRVEKAGQKPMDAIVSATSGAAESLGLGDRIGAIAPGMEADIIAVDGDPLQEISTLQRVVFVMKGGKVYKNVPAGAAASR